MAIYHLSGQVISRAAGRSGVASAAYRAGEKLLDERTGLTHDFEKKAHDVEHRVILTPKHAPDAMKERGKLWNLVEASEKRKDAQLAREFNIALPKELTLSQNIKLAEAFVQKAFVDKGMVADLCIHKGHTHGETQPHLHVMLTMREVTADGFGQKVREWNNKALLFTWREQWAEMANEHLRLHGHDMRIDHRTLVDQGIDLIPQTKIGAASHRQQLDRYHEHRAIAKENGDRILRSPSIALDAITKQQSTFTHHDLARFIHRHTDGEEQFTRVYQTVKAHDMVVALGRDGKGMERFTTQDMLTIEAHLIEKSEQLASRNHFALNANKVEAYGKKHTLSDQQQAALNHIACGKDLSCIVGYAGTGKSRMLGAAREAFEAQGYQVHGMSLSGMAAQNLEASSGIKSRTVASVLYGLRQGQLSFSKQDVVVIDEAGMLGSKDMATLISAVEKSGAKCVAIGDVEQLQAIDAGAAFRGVLERVGCAELTQVRRQKERWQQEATIAFAKGQTKDALSAYQEKGCIERFATQQAAMHAMVERWEELRSTHPEKSQLMLAYTRSDTVELNRLVRDVRLENDELGACVTLSTERGSREFAVGERLYFLKNEYHDLDVKNGTLGTLKSIHGKELCITLDKTDNQPARDVVVNTEKYNDLEYGYAATVHKGQGNTVGFTHHLPSKYQDRHATYVAMSRHTEAAYMYWSREHFPSFNELSRVLSTAREKDFTQDYFIEPQSSQDRLLKEQVEKDRQSLRNDGKEMSEVRRLFAARERLEERKLAKMLAPHIERLSKETGLSITRDVHVNDVGHCVARVKLSGEAFALLQKNDHEGVLVRPHVVEHCKGGDKVCIQLQKSVDPNYDHRHPYRAEIIKPEPAIEKVHQPTLSSTQEIKTKSLEVEQGIKQKLERSLDRGFELER